MFWLTASSRRLRLQHSLRANIDHGQRTRPVVTACIWLTAIFGGFDNARVWHFWLMVFFIVFLIPHVVLAIADGWDTLRSMITGWSTKFKRSEVSDHEL